ncbi:hypothetical protein [Streptomyces sp. WM6372]|uniref:hypothetical protein n=1 Tax=Streptomyces sp. WM6372 TaxID=1415555 RepID=UPI0015F8E007|nr:hypothetical protein [Streptomyces sp. WM6372]
MINEEDEWLLSRRIENDETELPVLIGDVLAISDDVLSSGARSKHLSHRPVDQDHKYIPQPFPSCCLNRNDEDQPPCIAP